MEGTQEGKEAGEGEECGAAPKSWPDKPLLRGGVGRATAELSKIPTMSKGLPSSPKQERRRKVRAVARSCGTKGAESSRIEGGRGPRGVSDWDSRTTSEYRRWAL